MTWTEVCACLQAELPCSVSEQDVKRGSVQDSVSNPTVWSIASEASAPPPPTPSQVQHDDMGSGSAAEHGLVVQLRPQHQAGVQDRSVL